MKWYLQMPHSKKTFELFLDNHPFISILLFVSFGYWKFIMLGCNVLKNDCKWFKIILLPIHLNFFTYFFKILRKLNFIFDRLKLIFRKNIIDDNHFKMWLSIKKSVQKEFIMIDEYDTQLVWVDCESAGCKGH